MSIEQNNDTYAAVCDNCGLRLPKKKYFIDAVNAVHKNKWHTVRSKEGITDYCPYCWQELQEEQP